MGQAKDEEDNEVLAEVVTKIALERLAPVILNIVCRQQKRPQKVTS